MEAADFAIKDSIYLSSCGALYDLHNDYDFDGYSLDKTIGRATLSWKRGSGDWVNTKAPSKIVLSIKGIEKFTIEEGRPDASRLDQLTLEEVAYLAEADWCDGPFISPWPPERNWDWVFIFASDLWITINAKSVSAEISP